jgi:phosphotransferase system enzyme I (PtsI)
LEANIEFPDDLASVRYAGAEGIGLYRTEFLLTDQAGFIEEDAQFAVYRSLLEGMAPGPVTIRTFDVDQERLARHGDRAAFSATGFTTASARAVTVFGDCG